MLVVELECRAKSCEVLGRNEGTKRAQVVLPRERHVAQRHSGPGSNGCWKKANPAVWTFQMINLHIKYGGVHDQPASPR